MLARMLTGSFSARLFWAAGALAVCGALAVAQGKATRKDIASPGQYWRNAGYVALVPAIRVSISPGTETLIYLHVPDGAKITTRLLAEQGRHSFVLPPGSAADRVSLSLREGAIEDVRGTRWGSDGSEFFHVYRPTKPGAGAPLAGYEWRRDNAVAAAAATKKLLAMMRSVGRLHPDLGMSRDDAGRFSSLNQCQSCHQADKPVALDDRDPLPPWATDGSGLYVPISVFDDSAPLSMSDAFDDPNADDRFVTATCAGAPAARETGYGARYFSCPDGAMAMGRYDLQAALDAGDEHAQKVCASRRYIFSHLDETGRAAFAKAMAPCRNGEPQG